MARKARPVDPDASPLHAFAHDLRVLREHAGNPTYRVLARTAGFSATTLSEAAGGVRLPSLDVTLAYVGACGGDGAEWEERWRQVDRFCAAQAVSAALTKADARAEAEKVGGAAGDAAEIADTSVPEASATVSTDVSRASRISRIFRRRSVRSRVAQGLLAGTVLVAAAFWLSGSGSAAGPGTKSGSGGSAPQSKGSGPTAGCPSFPGPGAFAGETTGIGAHVRTAANATSAVLRTFPSGCTLQFSGYCLGTLVGDWQSGIPDERWFKLEGGGLVASAIIHGNPPPDLAPTECAGAVPYPGAIRLAAAPTDSPGVVDLRATGTDVWIVGYAALYVPVGASSGTFPIWHQIGSPTVAAQSAEFTVPWRLGKVGEAPDGPAGMTVVAVACVGGMGPTTVSDAETFSPTAPAAASTALLTPRQLTTAAGIACGY